jgi:hypothetical protein
MVVSHWLGWVGASASALHGVSWVLALNRQYRLADVCRSCIFLDTVQGIVYHEGGVVYWDHVWVVIPLGRTLTMIAHVVQYQILIHHGFYFTISCILFNGSVNFLVVYDVFPTV